MATHPFSADQFPGQPQELPPVLTLWARRDAYKAAAEEGASVGELGAVYADVGQRLAQAMKEPES